jgi:tetratricopeptide (TPR) repeat protein
MAELIALRGMGSTARAQTRTVLIAFPDKKSFQPHIPVDDGRRRDVAGYVMHLPAGHWIGFAEYDPRGRAVAHHEYTHTLVAQEFQRVPLCLNEGLAEYFSTFELSPDGVRFGHRLPWHEYTLGSAPLFPADELFKVGPDSPAYRGGQAAQVFYAESWELVRYLMRTNAGAGRFMPFVRSVAEGKPARDAFQEFYPSESWDGLPDRLRAFASDDDSPYSEISLSSPLADLHVMLSEPRAGEVAAQTAIWRSRAEDVDPVATAEQLKLTLAQAPGLGLALAAQGLLAQRAGALDEALGRFRDAARDSGDALASSISGIGILQVGLTRDSTGADPVMAEGRDVLAAALRREPDDAAALSWYLHATSAWTGAGAGAPLAGDGKRAPASGWTESMAQLKSLLDSHRFDDALQYLNSLSDPPAEVAEYLVATRDSLAVYLRRQHGLDAYNQGIAAMNARQYRSAEESFRHVHELTDDVEVRAQAEARLRDIAGMAEYDEAVQALRAKRYAPALSLFEQAEKLANNSELRTHAHSMAAQLRPLVPARAGSGASPKH